MYIWRDAKQTARRAGFDSEFTPAEIMRIHAAQRQRLARLDAAGADADDVPTVGELLDRSSGKPLSDDLRERWEARFTEKRVSF